jgi:outer membrane immunogenic protein
MGMMKRILLASLALAAMGAAASPAAAADLPRQMPVKAPAYAPAYFTWTGFYLGINGGWGFGHSNWSGIPTGDFSVNGGLIGGTAGYNWQFGQAVFGLEGDLDWSGISGSTTTNCPAGCKTSNNWLSTVRGRLGYAGDRWMPYVTGGAAFGDIKATVPGFAGVDTTKAGWTVGAGVEYAFAGPWSAKLEYLYVDLGNNNCGFSCGAVSPDNVNLKTNIVRGGINYRF